MSWPPARMRGELLRELATRPAMGEGSLRAWGLRQRPPIGLSSVEAIAAELVASGQATREVRPDGSAIYRPVQRRPEPLPIELETPAPPRERSRPRPPAPAPAPEPSPTPEAEEEPVLVAGTPAEPCAVCERLRQELAELRRTGGTGGPVLHQSLTLPAPQRELLARALADLATALRGQAVPDARPISPMMRTVLGVLPVDPAEAISPTEVARRAGVDRGSTYAALRRLGDRGLATTVGYGLWRRAS